MTATTWEEFQSAHEAPTTTFKALGSVLALAPETAAVPGALTSDGIKVNALPTDYDPLGMFTDDGITFDRDVSTDPTPALGHLSPVREDISEATRGFTVNLFEVMRRKVQEVAEAIDLAGAIVDPVTGEVSWEIPDIPNQIFYRALHIGFDGSITKPTFRGKFYPRVSVISFPSETWNKSASSLEIGFRAYEDPDLGYIEKPILAGKGFLAKATSLGWTLGTGV